jgi:hypothetical protein
MCSRILLLQLICTRYYAFAVSVDGVEDTRESVELNDILSMEEDMSMNGTLDGSTSTHAPMTVLRLDNMPGWGCACRLQCTSLSARDCAEIQLSELSTAPDATLAVLYNHTYLR